MDYLQTISKHIQRNLISSLLILTVLLLIFSRVITILNYRINKDEFLYLSRVYDLLNDRLFTIFQTGHTYLFQWISLVPDHEIEKIIAVRFAILLLQIVTGVSIFLISKKFFSHRLSLFNALFYSSRVKVKTTAF